MDLDDSTVTPRSGGYGDVTATYIHRAEIPSRIYVKHQYRQESEYGARGALNIPTYEYNYKVITRGDKYYKNITSLISANARIQRDVHV